MGITIFLSANTFCSTLRIVSGNSSSPMPAGSSSPQLRFGLLETYGQTALRPIDTTLSATGISAKRLKCMEYLRPHESKAPHRNDTALLLIRYSEKICPGSLLIRYSEKICPGSLSFSFGGNPLSKISASSSSTKYPCGGAYSPVTPSRYPGISSLHRKNDASAPSGRP